jgi:putative membrane protein insertion efficiency factor
MIMMLRVPAVLLLSAYRHLVSPLLPRACRFYPSCSVYTKEAIQRYGVLKGIAFGFGRIGRCHPWHPGGYDPVK